MRKIVSFNCPNCGSSNLTKIEEATYKCTNCGTTSFAEKGSDKNTLVLVISKNGMSPETRAESRRNVPLWAQILIWAGLLGLLAILAIGLMKAQHPIVAVGSPTPNFTLSLFDGFGYKSATQVKLAELRGKVVLVNFWASWCKPCEQEAPDLEAAWKSYQPDGQVVFLGVDYVDTEPEALSYMAKFGITFPNGPDLGTRISQAFNRNMGVPESYIIDRQGILRFIQIGPFQSVEEIKSIIDPLLAGN